MLYTPVTVRFSENNMDSLEKIDRICAEFKISRANAIKVVVDRLIAINSTIPNPSSLPLTVSL